MNEDTTELDLSMWFSTYGFLTSQRILERLNLHLTQNDLMVAIKNTHCAYFIMLRVPLKNIFNGIILQQAHDYQVYAQKIFIDYLLSGESGKDETLPGANTRDDLEQERTKLMEIGAEFSKLETEHQILISESQASLIELSSERSKVLQATAKKLGQILTAHQILKEDKLIEQALRSAMIHYNKSDHDMFSPASTSWSTMSEVLAVDLNKELRSQLFSVLGGFGDARNEMENTLSAYIEQTEDMGVRLRSYRSQFYDIILRATDLIKLLPDYHVDKEKEEENRSSLYFDAHIGGE